MKGRGWSPFGPPPTALSVIDSPRGPSCWPQIAPQLATLGTAASGLLLRAWAAPVRFPQQPLPQRPSGCGPGVPDLGAINTGEYS